METSVEMSPHYGAPHRGTGVRLIPREYSLLLGGGKKKEEEEICIFPPRKNYYLISRDSENK